MKTSAAIYLSLLLLLPWGTAAAEQYRYELRVDGMACAFCAYNATKHLGELPGVRPQAVDVELQNGTVQIASHRSLAREAVASALESAGFSLLDITRISAINETPAAPAGRLVAQLEFDAEAVRNGEVEPLLEALGATLAETGGRIKLHAPPALEGLILKPLLMARKSAIPVVFEARDMEAGQVSLQWFRASSAED